MSGIRTSDLNIANDLDDVIVTLGGETRRLSKPRLVGLLAAKMGPSYQTRAQLYADLAWAADTIGSVWGDSTGGFVGTYKKTGAGGSGGWTRIGDLPQSPLNDDKLAQKADKQVVDALSAAGNAVYLTRAEAKTAAPTLPPTILRLINLEGSALIIRGRTATADDPLFSTGDPWGVLMRIDTPAALSRAGILPLTGIGGTADAITASLDSAVATALSDSTTVELVPVADNTGAVTLNVGGAGAWPVRRQDGTALLAGDLRTGRGYLLRRRALSWRLTAPASSEIGRLGTANKVSSRTAAVSGQVVTITVPSDKLYSWTDNTLVEVLWPAGQVWPAAGTVTVTLVDELGDVVRSGSIGRPPAPGAGSWFIFRPFGVNWTWVNTTPSPADVDQRARSADVAARFDALALAGRRVAVTPVVTAGLPLQLDTADSPAPGETFSIMVPIDAALPGLKVKSGTITRTVGHYPNGVATITAVQNTFKTGDILTLRYGPHPWLELLYWWPGGQLVADLQTRVATAETLLADTVVNLRQVDNTLPVRPNVRYADWLCWSDPTNRMKPWDRWVKMVTPTLPGIPSAAELSVMRLTGTAAGALVFHFDSELEDRHPRLQKIEYQVDGGGWQTLKSWPFHAGDEVTLTGLSAGDHELRFRLVNFLGFGEPTPVRRIRIHGVAFVDDFSKAFGWSATDFVNRDNWRSGANWTITATGEATSSAVNIRRTTAVSWAGIAADRGAGLWVEGYVYRETGATRLATVGFVIIRDINDEPEIQVQIEGTTWRMKRDATVLASGDMPAPFSGGAILRLAVSADGETVSAFADGVLLTTIPNPSPAGTTLYPGIHFSTPGNGGVGEAYIRNFSAGWL